MTRDNETIGNYDLKELRAMSHIKHKNFKEVFEDLESTDFIDEAIVDGTRFEIQNTEENNNLAERVRFKKKSLSDILGFRTTKLRLYIGGEFYEKNTYNTALRKKKTIVNNVSFKIIDYFIDCGELTEDEAEKVRSGKADKSLMTTVNNLKKRLHANLLYLKSISFVINDKDKTTVTSFLSEYSFTYDTDQTITATISESLSKKLISEGKLVSHYKRYMRINNEACFQIYQNINNHYNQYNNHELGTHEALKVKNIIKNSGICETFEEYRKSKIALSVIVERIETALNELLSIGIITKWIYRGLTLEEAHSIKAYDEFMELTIDYKMSETRQLDMELTVERTRERKEKEKAYREKARKKKENT